MEQTMEMSWRERLGEWLGVIFFFGLFILAGLVLMALVAGSTEEPIGIIPGLMVMIFPFFLLHKGR
ncbi:MAG: hypothetical protein WCT18_04820 [Patescibacteria group bacterium]